MASKTLKKINAWYVETAKGARWMDLIGDYAGDELFVVDGESLLQLVLDDPLLDIGRGNGCGFQIVHAIYLLETFLSQLLTRNANIEIVFFQPTLHATTRPGSTASIYSARVLARQLLLKHLERLSVPMYHFDNLKDPAWIDHEAVYKPMFVLIADTVKSTSPPDAFHDHYLGSQRDLIFDIISYGLPVALMNGLQFRDSKISTFVLEHQRPPSAIWSMTPLIAGLSDIAASLRAPMASVVQQKISSRTPLLVAIVRAFNQSQAELSSIQRALLYVFVLHVFTLDTLSLKDRIQKPPHFSSSAQSLLQDNFYPMLYFVTAHLISSEDASVSLDMDMNVFCALLAYLRTGVAVEEAISHSILSEASDIWNSAGAGAAPKTKELVVALAIFQPAAGEPSQHGIDVVEDPDSAALLPFSNPVFDDILSSVNVTTSATDIDPTMPYLDFSHVFSDSQHWHNQNKLITLGDTGAKKLSYWALRSNQRYMRSLHRQAETLTGALGQGLRQITITTVPTRKDKSEKKKATIQQHANKKGKPKPLTKTERMKLEIAEAKASEQDNSSRAWFQKYLKDHKDDDIPTKLASFDGLQRSARFSESWLGVEGRLYEMHLKFCAWIDHPERESASTRDDFTVSFMRIIGKVADSGPLSPERASVVSDVLTVLGFAAYVPQIVSVAQQTSPSPLVFKFVKIMKSGRPLYAWMCITEHPVRWQLRVYGPYMDRSMDGAWDARVDFKPDGWQRQALDCIDDPKHSVLVVAPTSAGKTFVSFYAMEKVLRDSDDGIIVYIAPTKALVNQIVAEIYARFSKKLDKGTLWSIHTRDYRVNDPQNCQILVTVPEVLAIMLLSPPLASKWTPRMKRIILDEIHTIGQQDGGAVWEQILLLAPCPIIGLSATVGSPDRFNDWLASLAKAHGWKHSFIQHKHRYSHLRKFYYRLDDLKAEGVFSGLQASQTTDRLRFLHPISMLSFQVGRKTLPDDLALEPADTLSLFDVIAKQRAAAPDLVARLDPTTFFDSVGCRLLRQSDILRYESELKQLLSADTMNDATASLDVDGIVDDLTDDDVLQADPQSKDLRAGFLPLAVDLDKRQLLPAIFFNFDRSLCEGIAQNLLQNLVAAEKAWKSESPSWNRKLSQWQAWKNSEKTRQREEDRATRARKKDPDDRPDDVSESRTWESTFDPDAPLPDFSFAGLYSKSELDEQIREELWKFDKSSWLIQALRRGIAVHHAGMNKRYRSLIESLFRRGIIRIMISTGTLALGINAPAKTSVFCGDSPFLTALQYRQCAGRAGRRGYDLLGNVIFYGLPIDRVQRLVLSKLPSLGGTFPLTATLTLRLLNLLHGSNNAPYAVSAIQNIMQLPQISFGSSMGRSQLQQHLRFNIEYLRRARLIDRSGAPINLSAICAHLYYTEPSNFALVTLLHRGILHRISEEVEAEREFICLMSHLFGRRYLPSALSGSEELIRLKKTYPSMIELPPLREDARSLLIAHDEEIRHIFRNYAMTYVVQYADELGSDHNLPLSGVQYPGSSADNSSFVTTLRRSARWPLIRSHFVANSGHGDTFATIEELAHTARSGVHLSEYAIPNMRPYTMQGEGEHTLNAYLLDFYVHGQSKTLAVANGIRKGELWFLLQDFMLTLLTVKASLEQYLTRIGMGSDMELAEDVMAIGADLAEIDNDSEDGEGFARPAAVSDEDWRVYVMVKTATAQFDEKYRKIWA